eukprot:3940519-Rhodomonas_salina.1
MPLPYRAMRCTAYAPTVSCYALSGTPIAYYMLHAHTRRSMPPPVLPMPVLFGPMRCPHTVLSTYSTLSGTHRAWRTSPLSAYALATRCPVLRKRMPSQCSRFSPPPTTATAAATRPPLCSLTYQCASTLVPQAPRHQPLLAATVLTRWCFSHRSSNPHAHAVLGPAVAVLIRGYTCTDARVCLYECVGAEAPAWRRREAQGEGAAGLLPLEGRMKAGGGARKERGARSEEGARGGRGARKEKERGV